MRVCVFLYSVEQFLGTTVTSSVSLENVLFSLEEIEIIFNAFEILLLKSILCLNRSFCPGGVFLRVQSIKVMEMIISIFFLFTCQSIAINTCSCKIMAQIFIIESVQQWATNIIKCIYYPNLLTNG